MTAPGPSAFEREWHRASRLCLATDRYLVGVSGGRDSVALLHALTASGYRRLVVCHLDHGLRGKGSRADARFVERLAAAHNLPVDIGRANVRAVARERKISLETAAREARYQFFAVVAARRRCWTLLLAHHADDQVETFLFNLLRGAGTAGMAGMASKTTRAVGRHTLQIVRPLLGVWRTGIDAYLAAHGLKWREDLTNADPDHATRNRLRAEVLPMLERVMGRDIRPALRRAADLLRAEETWMSGLLDPALSAAAQLPLAVLEGEPVAKQRRLIRSWLAARGLVGIGYHEVENVRALLDKTDGPAKVNLPGGRHARRRGGKLFVE